MKYFDQYKLSLITLILIFSLLSVKGIYPQIAIKGDTIYTMAGEPIENGVVLIKEGKIEKVGAAKEITIPSSYTIYSGKVVTPGLIDAHTVVGLAGILNYSHDQEQLEKSDPIQPELRAIDAYNPLEDLVEWVRNFGVTTIHTGHGPGALISGQTMITKTVGETVGESLIDTTAMVAFTLGPRVDNYYKKPGTRAKGIAMLRQEFINANEYLKKKAKKKESFSVDLKYEVLGKVLKGVYPALFTVNRGTEIMDALRLQEEFGFKLVLDGAAESYLLIDEIKAADVPVILHPTMIRTYGEYKNATFETASKLQKAGILFALQSGYESYVPKTRVVLFEAGLSAANGLTFEEALASITINAAKILGIDERVGSIEEGKDADLVIYDGDPFEYTSHVCKVFVDGKLVSDECN